jgi:MFS family permease
MNSNKHDQQGGFYFGWIIVCAATFLTLLTVGMRLSVGPFFLPITSDLHLSRSDLSGIIATGMMIYGLSMPVAGQLVNAWGTRAVLLIGAAIVAVSMIGTAMSSGPLGLLAFFGVGQSIGLAFTSPISVTPVISRWFIRQRGMALFLLSAGSMAGIAVLTPVFSAAITAFGWRETLLGFAAVFVLLTVPSALFIIREQAPPGADLHTGKATGSTRPTHAGWPEDTPPLRVRDALQTLPFWQLALGLFACGFSMNLLGTHGVPMLMDHGFGVKTSSFGIALIGLVAIFSSFALGKFSDIVERRNILALIYIVRGLGFFGLVEAALPWQLYSVAVIGGVVWAGSVALSSAIMADVYGTRLVGVLCGWAYVSHQIGGTLSSWLGGWAYETYHTHLIAFGMAGVLLFAAAVISLRLPRRGVMLAAPQAMATH